MDNYLRCVSENFIVRIAQNNSIKIWNSESEFLSHQKNVNCELLFSLSEPNQLTFDYTAMQIYDTNLDISLPPTLTMAAINNSNSDHNLSLSLSQSQKTQKSQKNVALLLLGDSNGRIIFFDMLSGKKMIEKTICHGFGINCIEFLYLDKRCHFLVCNNRTLFECELELNNDSSASSSSNLISVLNTINFASFSSSSSSSAMTMSNQFLSRFVCNVKYNYLISATHSIQIWKQNLLSPPSPTTTTTTTTTSQTQNQNNTYLNDFNESNLVLNIKNGHSCNIEFIQLTSDDKYLITAAKDRYINVWKCKKFDPQNKKKKHKKKKKKKTKNLSPKYSVSLESDIIAIDLYSVPMPIAIPNPNPNPIPNTGAGAHTKQKHEKAYLLIGCSQLTAIIWRFNQTDIQIISEIEIVSQDIIHSNIYSLIDCIQFIDESHICVYRGTSMIAVKKKMKIQRKLSLDAVLINKNDRNNSTNNANSDLKQKNVDTDVHSSRIHNNGDVQVLDVSDCMLPSITMNDRNTKKSSSTVATVAITTTRRKRHRDEIESTSTGTESKSAEADTGAERIGAEALSLSLPSTKKMKMTAVMTAVDQENATDGGAAIAGMGAGVGTQLVIPRANSMASIIIQALTANDDQMFLSMMLKLQIMNDDMRSANDNDRNYARETTTRIGVDIDDTSNRHGHDDDLFTADLISNSLSQLSDDLCVELLSNLSNRLRIWPRQSIILLKWIFPLLQTHFPLFATNLECRQYLVSIHQSIDYQIRSLMPVMKLQGRLSLLLKDQSNAASNRNRSSVSLDSSSTSTANPLKYTKQSLFQFKF